MNVSDIGIDLGTASILIYVRGKGVVLKEPSVVAYDRDADKIRAIGDEARIMLSRTTGNIGCHSSVKEWNYSRLCCDRTDAEVFYSEGNRKTVFP